MITSDRQLAVAQKKIKELIESVKKLEGETRPFAQSSLIQIKALTKELKQEIKEYENLKQHGLDGIEISDLSELLLLPIKYRIAKNMTLNAFAKMVDVSERMIARYESEQYRNISGENLHKILSKLRLKLPGKIQEA